MKFRKILALILCYALFSLVILKLHSIESKSPGNALKNSFLPAQENYEGTKLIINWTEKKSNAFEINIRYDKSNKYRFEFKSPPFISGRVIIDDSVNEWQYEPTRQLLIKRASDLKSREKILELFGLLSKNYNFNFLQDEKILGRDCYVVQLLSKNSNNIFRELWIDKKYNLILQSKWYENNKPVIVSNFTSVFFPRTMPAELFRPETGQGIRVIEEPSRVNAGNIEGIAGKIRFEILAPENIPQGYTFENADILSYKNTKIAHLKYTDGLNVISIFESNYKFDIRPPKMEFSDIVNDIDVGEHAGRENMYHSSSRNVNYIIIGNIDSNSLKEIAKSLK